MRRWIRTVLVGLFVGSSAFAIDLDFDGIDDGHEDSLLQTFAPIVRLASDDPNRPGRVEQVLDTASLGFNSGAPCGVETLLDAGDVTAFNLTSRTTRRREWQGILNGGCVETGSLLSSNSHKVDRFRVGFVLDFDKDTRGGTPQSQWTVYGHVYPGLDGRTVVQYWFWYPYNHAWGSFNHEGDWEFMAVVLDAQDQPEEYVLANHGAPRSLAPGQVDTSGNHPIVYSARGTHATYAGFDSDGCLGAPTTLGFGIDDCDDDGPEWRTWEPGFGGIENVGELSGVRSGFNWLKYSGMWGQVGALASVNFKHTTGPSGPAFQRESWHIKGGHEICGNALDDDVDGDFNETDCVWVTPDLVMTDNNPAIARDGHSGPILVEPGDTFPVRCALNNFGIAFSESFDVEFRLSQDRLPSADDIVLSGCLGIPGMPASFSFPPVPTWDVGVPVTTPAGEYYVIAIADAADTVDEGPAGGEDNNWRASEMRVTVVEPGTSPNQATAAGGSSASVPLDTVIDNFSDGLAQAFVPIDGTWSAAIETLVGTGSGGDHATSVTLVSAPSPSARLSFHFALREEDLSAAPHLGAVLRYESATRWLRVDLVEVSGETRLRLVAAESGPPVVLGDVAVPIDLREQLHRVEIDDTGCRVAVSIDETPFLDTAYVSGVATGSRGLYVNHAHTVGFDNFLLQETPPPDADGDGWSVCAGDCNDTSAAVHPGRSESCANRVDDNCNGAIDEGCRARCRNCPELHDASPP